MKANRLNLYSDVRQVLDQALANGGGEYILSTHGQAVHWRQRAYKFRKEYARVHGTSPYDDLEFPRIDADSNKVTIAVRQPKGVFVSKGGKPALDLAAEELASKLLGGDAL